MIAKFINKIKTMNRICKELSLVSGDRSYDLDISAAKKNVLIVGGELFNKGAQAMTFTAVDNIRQMFPNKDIYLLSSLDDKRPEEEKNIYSFDILPWDFEVKIEFLDSDKGAENKFKDIFNNACFIIDISGYALSSQWGRGMSLDYLLNIIIGMKYNLPFYIFPQSIGPFNYGFINKMILYPMIKKCLKYPEVIYAREEKSKEYLKEFTRSNVKVSADIVLTAKEYNLDNIYSVVPDFARYDIAPGSVGIVPNLRVFEHAKNQDLFSLYKSIINYLLKGKKNIYIFNHSEEDIEICEKLKGFFADNSRVNLIKEELSSIEIDMLIRQFDFIVAARYHAIVHGYKHGIPSIVIGWSDKYLDLLRKFNKESYFFSCDYNVTHEDVISKIKNMQDDLSGEKKSIVDRLCGLNEKDVFECLLAEK